MNFQFRDPTPSQFDDPKLNVYLEQYWQAGPPVLRGADAQKFCSDWSKSMVEMLREARDWAWKWFFLLEWRFRILLQLAWDGNPVRVMLRSKNSSQGCTKCAHHKI